MTDRVAKCSTPGVRVRHNFNFEACEWSKPRLATKIGSTRRRRNECRGIEVFGDILMEIMMFVESEVARKSYKGIQ